MENLLIGILFLSAVIYLSRLVYRQFTVKNVGCANNCGGGCGAKISLHDGIEK